MSPAGLGGPIIQPEIDPSPSDEPLYRNLTEATRYLEAGRLHDAEALFRGVLALQPGQPDARHGLGLVALHSGDTEGAIEHLRAAVAANDAFPPFHNNLGVALKAMGRYREAETAFRRAVALAPDYVDAHYNLCAVFDSLGAFDKAADGYRAVLELDPGNGAALNNLGSALHRIGRDGEAETVLRRALDLDPRNSRAWSNLGNVQEALGRPEAARELFERSVAVDPNFATGHANLAGAYLKAAQPEKALVACDACLACDPGNRQALALRTIALRSLGRTDEARELGGPHKLVCGTEIGPPAGFPDLVAFNEALVREARADPSLAFEPAFKATRSGSQTENLLGPPGSAVAALRIAMAAAVEDYVMANAAREIHPHFANRPGRSSFTLWATFLNRSGHQQLHIHPAGWLSGVYYAKVPDSVSAPDAPTQGWIEFGGTPDEYPDPTVQERLVIQPKEGSLLLFPSYLFHRTIALETDEERVSFAFDLLARD